MSTIGSGPSPGMPRPDGLRLRLLEVGGPLEDALVGELVVDPHCRPPVLAASAADGRRPVLVHAEATGWRAVYPLVCSPTGDGRWLARTPDYGGPWIDAPASRAVDAARTLRRALDEALPGHGIISEVCVLSVWLPHRAAIADAWAARTTREVVLLPVAPGGGDPESFSSGRRYDLRRAARAELTVTGLDHSAAAAFAERYGAWMHELGASSRFRLGSGYFTALADAGADGVVVRCDGASGGAAALFLRHRHRASYAYAVRWGRAPGTPSVVIAAALRSLSWHGPAEVLLGGGRTDDPGDGLLRFKRSWGGRSVPLPVAARVFDPDAHRRLAEAGRARDLPEWAVRP